MTKKNKTSKETLMEVNKKMVLKEDQRIDDFITRYKWQMRKTKTGLRYMIYKKGNGIKAERGKIATINYEVKLLTGELCYTSKTLGPKTFKIGKGGVESGLEEVILFLKKGDRAKIIIPSHLAFGLVGDGNKIPAMATLVYDLELIELK
jgi:FKBP-type peptidyl-prolyl cis-trans isomerase